MSLPTLDAFKTEQAKRYTILEGSLIDDQAKYISEFLVQHPDVKRIMEIGFNGGYGSACFLAARSDITVVSLDIGRWDYVKDAKKLIDEYYPGRHTLVIGDSTQTLPKYQIGQGEPFDLVFIDGGHHTPVPQLDIKNSLPLLRPNGFILMDDYCTMHGSNGVIAAWDECVRDGRVKQVYVTQKDAERGWALGTKN